MPKAKSKAQQALFFAMARRGEIPMAEARARARKGKSYKAMPTKLKRKRRR
jgi:hypothetical protein